MELPSDEEMIVIAKSYFDRYGLLTILVSAMLEAVLLLGLYYPGGLVILLGVIFAEGDIFRIIQIIVVTTIGMCLGYVINFLMGRYGWYRLFVKFGLQGSIDKAKARLEKHETKAIVLSAWHPNFTSFTATAAGILHLNFIKFFSTVLMAAICWNIFWGTFAALLGEASLAVMGARFIMIVVIVWIAYIFWEQRKSKTYEGSI